MAESKILLALEVFKSEYAWDKSLIVAPKPARLTLPAPIEFDPLEKFSELSKSIPE